MARAEILSETQHMLLGLRFRFFDRDEDESGRCLHQLNEIDGERGAAADC